MGSWAILKSCGRTGARWCWGLLNVLLLLLALAAGGLAWLIHQGRGIPAPRAWSEHLARQAETLTGLHLDWEALRIDPVGAKLFVRHLRVGPAGGSELFADFASVQADLNLPALLLGEWRVDYLRVDRGRLLAPAMLASTGLNEPVLTDLHLALHRRRRGWALEGAVARLGPLTLAARGEWEHSRDSRRRRAAPVALQPVLGWYYRTLRQVESVQPYLAALDQPRLEIEFNRPADLPDRWRAQVSCHGGHWGEWSWGPARLAPVEYFGGSARPHSPLILETAWVRGPRDLALEHVTARAPWPADLAAQVPLPASLELTAGKVAAMGENAEGLVAHLDLSAWPEVSGHVAARWAGGLPRLSFRADAVARGGRLQLEEGRLPPEVFHHPRLQPLLEQAALRFGEPPLLAATAEFAPGASFTAAKFRLEARDVDCRGARFQRVAASGQLDRTGLQLDAARVENPGYTVSGSYRQTWDSLDFRLLLRGSVFPSDLDPLLPPWWDRLWERLRFAGPTAYGDFDYLGCWRDDFVGRILVWIEAHDFHYRELPIDRCRLRLWRQRGFLVIDQLTATSRGRPLEGSIRWLYPRPGQADHQTHLDFRANLDLADLAVFEPEVGSLESLVQTEAPPHLEISGWSVHPPEGPSRRALHLLGRFPGRTTIARWPLDDLALTGDLADTRFHVPTFTAHLAEGPVQGQFDYLVAPAAARRLDLDFHLTGADLAASLALVKENFGVARPPPASPAPPAAAPAAAAGRLDLALRLAGHPGHPDSFTGAGTLRVHESDLGQVHLLGPLSRLLDTLGLGLATINLNRAEGSFTFARGLLHAPDLRLLGQNSRIEASGQLAFANEALDFTVKVFLLQSGKPTLGGALGGVIGTVISPISHVLALRLRGSLAEPQWSFAINPLNFLPLPGRSEPPPASDSAENRR